MICIVWRFRNAEHGRSNCVDPTGEDCSACQPLQELSAKSIQFHYSDRSVRVERDKWRVIGTPLFEDLSRLGCVHPDAAERNGLLMDIGQSLVGWQVGLLVTYGLIVLAAVLSHVVCTWQNRHLPFLKPRQPVKSSDRFPLVSIMVPARNEADQIERCVRSLLAQDYPNFEVLVVDDRSEDETADIVERLAKADQRLRLIRINSLPTGWTGKTNALHVCQQSARGEWLLFVDADTQHDRRCVKTVIGESLNNRLDLLSLLPALREESFWERVAQPFLGACLMMLFPPSRINNPNCRDGGFANGQFILIRRDAYQEIGGHAAVRDKFVEDIHLGRRVREQGLRSQIVDGAALTTVRMYASLDEIRRGWSRILYAAVDGKPAKLWFLFTIVCIFNVLPAAILVSVGLAIAAGSVSLLVVIALALTVVQEISQTLLFARTYGRSGSRLRYLAFRWSAVAVTLGILIRSIRLCRTRTVVWRGTHYMLGDPSAGSESTQLLENSPTASPVTEAA